MSNHVKKSSRALKLLCLSVWNRRSLFTGIINIAYTTLVLSFDRELARHKDVPSGSE